MKIILLFVSLTFIPSLVFAQNFQQLLEKGDEFFDAGNYTEAVKYFSQAIQADAKQAKGYWYRGDAYNKDKKYAEAIQDYQKAIELEPKNWLFYKKRGDCYYNTAQYVLAEKGYSQALNLDNSQPILWLYRGDCYRKLNQNEKACSDYQKAHELGDKQAQQTARDFACEWAKSLPEKPCPTQEFSLGKIEIEPFTGAIISSKGLSFREFEIKPSEGMGFITAAEIGLDEKFVIKLTYPSGFCANNAGEVFFGAGFTLYDENKKELGKINDLYESSSEGLPAEYLKSLSMTLGFSKPLEQGKKYVVKARFFDKRSKAEAFVELPFRISTKTQINNSVQSSKSTLGLGINSASVETEVKSIDFQLLNKKEKVDIYALSLNQDYQMNLYEIKNLSAGAIYALRWVNDKAEIVSEQSGKLVFEAGKAKLNINTKNIPSGNYQIWLKVQDNAGKNMGITIPTKLN